MSAHTSLLTEHDDLAEAVAWTLGRGVVSHESARVLHGISDEHDDIPVTTVERTSLDCLADGTDPYQLRLAVDQAEAEGSLRRSEAEALRARGSGRPSGRWTRRSEAAQCW